MRQIVLIFLGIICVMGFLQAEQTSEKNTVTVVYADYWKPYSFISGNGAVRGILVEIMDEILSKKLNMNVIHTGQPWKRAQKSVRSGFHDAMVTAPTADRLTYAQSSSNALYYLQWRVFVSKKSPNYSRIMNMDNPLEDSSLNFISLLGDRTSGRLYEKNNIKYKAVKNISNAIKMLEIGRVDIFVHSKIIMFEHLNKMQLGDTVSMHDKEYNKIPFTFLVSNKSSFYNDLVFRVDKVVTQMKKDNEYNKFIEEVEQRYLNLGK